MVVEAGRDGYRVINLNHETFHRVDQHGVVVIRDTAPEDAKGETGRCWGDCNSPGTVEPHISIYVDNIRRAIINRVSDHEQEISDKLGRPLDATWLKQHIDGYVRQTTTHELGHAIGIEHHLEEPWMPPNATENQLSPSGGCIDCVMRYLYDYRYLKPEDGSEPYRLPVEPHDEVLDILKGAPVWPDNFCEHCGCRAQIEVSDAAQ
jgi:hypothetical protein